MLLYIVLIGVIVALCAAYMVRAVNRLASGSGVYVARWLMRPAASKALDRR